MQDWLMMRRQNMDLVQQAIQGSSSRDYVHADATTSGIMILASGDLETAPAGLKSGIARG
jgi:hypothetical protein